MSRNPLYDAVIEEMDAVHDSKNADYGAAEDPFKNFMGSEEYDIPAWLGAEIRIGDKTRRVQEFVKKGKLNNESVRDSLLDRAIYCVIQVALYDRAQEVNDGVPAEGDQARPEQRRDKPFMGRRDF
jgi:hypothetical protein